MPFTVETTSQTEVRDITSIVSDHIPNEPDHGLAVIYCSHTTAGVVINEHEPRLCADIETFLTELVPEDTAYSHDQIDNNTASHLRSLLLAESVIAPVEDGTLSLGTWQSILLVECDGPNQRSLEVITIPAVQ